MRLKFETFSYFWELYAPTSLNDWSDKLMLKCFWKDQETLETKIGTTYIICIFEFYCQLFVCNAFKCRVNQLRLEAIIVSTPVSTKIMIRHNLFIFHCLNNSDNQRMNELSTMNCVLPSHWVFSSFCLCEGKKSRFEKYT